MALALARTRALLCVCALSLISLSHARSPPSLQCSEYFFEPAKLKDLARDNYVASTQDILYARVRTSGIVTERYLIDGQRFEMYDVGGQKNERRKWIHCFEQVTSVIFVAALSEYNMSMFEDERTNRMTDALELWSEMCETAAFARCAMILFLNKRDLFEQKIAAHPIEAEPAFADYDGPTCDYDGGVQYFVDRFLAMNTNLDRQIYHHVTCATDTSNVRVVFDSCRDVILQSIMQNSGLV